VKLFDDFDRTDCDPALYAESQFSYLNRTAKDGSDDIRQKMEEWFLHYQTSEQLELRSRFRSDIDTQHQSAFFELFLHELLIKLDCKVTPHPFIPSTKKTPDFYVEPSAGDPFYIEAALATYESADEVAARARINTVYDVLNREVDSSDFFLWLAVKGSPATPPSARKMASFVNNRISQLDPDKIAKLYESGGMNAVPCWNYEHDGWVIEFRPIPKTPEARNRKGVRPLGAFSMGFRFVDDRTPILEAITKKAGRYGELDFSYVIAVNALGFADDIDVTEALFGKEQFLIDFYEDSPREPIEPQMSRIPDGAWTSPEGPRNTRVSAVLLAIRLSPWNISQCNVRLFHNPWAQKSYCSVLNRLPQVVVESNHMKRIVGGTIGDILSISASWPI
jgi:hypothetical protein